MTLTPVLTAHWDEPDCYTIERLPPARRLRAAAHAAWRWTPTSSSPLVKESGLRGRGGAGFPTGPEVELRPAG